MTMHNISDGSTKYLQMFCESPVFFSEEGPTPEDVIQGKICQYIYITVGSVCIALLSFE